MTVAALYVETNGVYYGLPDVDPWDEARDARKYDGPWPVVAHPPCARWSILSVCQPKCAHLRGVDGGTFAAALEAVRTFGGVLEHPAYSFAWSEFDLPRPVRFGWASSLTDPGYATEVDQSYYGHECRKLTWLYCVDVDVPALRWGDGGKQAQNVQRLPGGRDGSARRSRTPAAFRDVLLNMARSAACGHRAPLNYDRSKWAVCDRAQGHSDYHGDAAGFVWTDATMPHRDAHPVPAGSSL